MPPGFSQGYQGIGQTERVGQNLGHVPLLRPTGGLGEGNGTPLQYSCLENPMDGGAWGAAVHGVAKSWT